MQAREEVDDKHVEWPKHSPYIFPHKAYGSFRRTHIHIFQSRFTARAPSEQLDTVNYSVH